MNQPRQRILVAEDDPHIAGLLLHALMVAGFEVETVPDGQAAWDRLSQEPRAFEVLITDNQMPRLTGLELVRKLSSAGFPGRIIVCSGNVTPALEGYFAGLGVNHILRKPVKWDMLLSAIKDGKR